MGGTLKKIVRNNYLLSYDRCPGIHGFAGPDLSRLPNDPGKPEGAENIHLGNLESTIWAPALVANLCLRACLHSCDLCVIKGMT